GYDGMDLGLAGKVAIVTGSSRGIGRSIALALAAEGAWLALCARGAERLEATRDEILATGAKAIAIPADVTSQADMERVVAAATEQFGRSDILVNNVGASTQGDEDEAWTGAFQSNILAAARATRLVAPHMRSNGG